MPSFPFNSAQPHWMDRGVLHSHTRALDDTRKRLCRMQESSEYSTYDRDNYFLFIRSTFSRFTRKGLGWPGSLQRRSNRLTHFHMRTEPPLLADLIAINCRTVCTSNCCCTSESGTRRNPTATVICIMALERIRSVCVEWVLPTVISRFHNSLGICEACCHSHWLKLNWRHIHIPKKKIRKIIRDVSE